MERPTGPEMERLAAIVSDHDNQLDNAPVGGKDAVFAEIVEGALPADVLAYVAVQRALRVSKALKRSGADEAHVFSQLASAWIDGFVAGARYERKAT